MDEKNDKMLRIDLKNKKNLHYNTFEKKLHTTLLLQHISSCNWLCEASWDLNEKGFLL